MSKSRGAEEREGLLVPGGSPWVGGGGHTHTHSHTRTRTQRHTPLRDGVTAGSLVHLQTPHFHTSRG